MRLPGSTCLVHAIADVAELIDVRVKAGVDVKEGEQASPSEQEYYVHYVDCEFCHAAAILTACKLLAV